MHIETLTGGMMGVNTYIVSAFSSAKECVLIDPGVPQAQLARALGDRRVCAVLLTHAHFDHMLSAQAFLDAGAKLYVGALDAPALRDEALNLCGMAGEQVCITQKPVCLYDGDTVREAGVRLKVLSTPGHTPGGVCYLSEEGTLFSGDTLFAGGYGRVDFPGGSMRELRASLRRLCGGLPAGTRVLCGHGGETTIAWERRRND
jgi:hydroxyacylglutathione hydrolase